MTREERALERINTLFAECKTLECIESTKDTLHAELSINKIDEEIINYMFSKASERVQQI